MLGGNLFKGVFRPILPPFAVALLQLSHVLLKGRRLFQRMALIETKNSQCQGDKERNTPAPLQEILLADNR